MLFMPTVDDGVVHHFFTTVLDMEMLWLRCCCLALHHGVIDAFLFL
jgi:hypothetical protein